MKKETELFEPVASFLMEKGYDVRAEVRDCDIVAIKDHEVVIVELKLKFNMDLLLQVSDRLRYTDKVYLAIPSSEINLFKKKGKKQRHMLRMLEVGLLTVRVSDGEFIVKEVLEPKVMNRDQLRKRNKRKNQLLLNEFKGREKLANIGGSTRTSIHTAYKELNINIAKALTDGPLSIKEIKENVPNDKVGNVLQKNYYGWYERVDRGVYQLTIKGINEIESLI
jgi:hypothetical protein